MFYSLLLNISIAGNAVAQRQLTTHLLRLTPLAFLSFCLLKREQVCFLFCQWKELRAGGILCLHCLKKTLNTCLYATFLSHVFFVDHKEKPEYWYMCFLILCVYSYSHFSVCLFLFYFCFCFCDIEL